MNMLDTLKNSYFSEILPAGWDIEKIHKCVTNAPESVGERQSFWNEGFAPVECTNLEEFGAYMGHEIAMQIKLTREEGRKLILILPVGPMGMYKWAVYFLKAWNVDCKHVYGFNMDEWADENGNTLPASDPAAFQNAMTEAFYGPLGELTVPENQRNFATKENLPTYPEKIKALKAEGAKQVLVYGIGRMCHIAFWEPHFAGDYNSEAEWLAAPYRIGARLHPFTIEQNAITSFRSSWPLIPCFANTIGPWVIFNSDYAIGGADDRLIGSSLLAMEQGITPAYITVGAAAGLHRYLKENAIEQTHANALKVLEEVSKLTADHALTKLILDCYADILGGATIGELCAKADAVKFASLQDVV